MKRFKMFAAAALLAIVASPASAASANNPVIATVGVHPITQEEVDAKLQTQLTSVESQLYELRRRSIESIADDYLVADAARKDKLSEAEYLKREVSDKVPDPSDAEAKKFYDDHKGQIGQPYDKVKGTLIAFMKQQQTEQLRGELMDKLRTAQPVKVLLKPPRFKVASAGYPALGPSNAPVTIVEFGDFQCPFCERSESTLKQLLAKYGNKVRLVYRDFPLSMHAHAFEAAEAAGCAGDQGKFWQYHDALFADQSKLAPDDLKAAAVKLALDKGKFAACLDQHKHEAAVKVDQAEGETLGVSGTPAFFIDGRPLTGALPLGSFQEIVDEELALRADHKSKAD